MKFSKQIVIATTLYLVLLLIDFGVTLFSINESGIYNSILGLKINMVMNEVELFTTFSLTPIILINYIICIFIIMIIFIVINKFKRKKTIQ